MLQRDRMIQADSNPSYELEKLHSINKEKEWIKKPLSGMASVIKIKAKIVGSYFNDLSHTK